MPIDVVCDGCGVKLVAPENLAGRRVKCRKCGTPIVVPELDPDGGEAATPSRLAEDELGELISDGSDMPRGIFDADAPPAPSPAPPATSVPPGLALAPGLEPWYIAAIDVGAKYAAGFGFLIGLIVVITSASGPAGGFPDATRLIVGGSILVGCPGVASPLILGVAILRGIRSIDAKLGATSLRSNRDGP